MRITRSQLRQIIVEEISQILTEAKERPVVIFLKKGTITFDIDPGGTDLERRTGPEQVTLPPTTKEVTLASDAELTFSFNPSIRHKGPKTVYIDELKDEAGAASQQRGRETARREKHAAEELKRQIRTGSQPGGLFSRRVRSRIGSSK